MGNNQLFAPSLDDMVRCVEREIRFRERVYPRFIERRKLSQQNADREIATMRAILEHLRMTDFRHNNSPTVIDHSTPKET
jgi:archaellum biogenesis protein FlaJ (TadC family)